MVEDDAGGRERVAFEGSKHLKTLKSCPYEIVSKLRSDKADFVTAGTCRNFLRSLSTHTDLILHATPWIFTKMSFHPSGSRWGLPTLLRMTLKPPSEAELNELRDVGREAAGNWLLGRP